MEALSRDLLPHPKIPMKARFGQQRRRKDGSEGKIREMPELVDLQRQTATRDEWIVYRSELVCLLLCVCVCVCVCACVRVCACV